MRFLRSSALNLRRRRLVTALACFGAAASFVVPPSASAAPRLETFALPSTAGNVDLAVAKVNAITELRATVQLPDGYDADPSRRWPVLYLLHGDDDDTSSWSNHEQGDTLELAADFPGIVVMPEGGRGWYTDAWMAGRRTGVNWERYELDEVLPAIESRYRILPESVNHAIGGLSMGGYGAMLLAAQLPTYFGTAISMSGLLDLEEPLAALVVPLSAQFSYRFEWGDYGGQYAQAHNPSRLLANLAGTRLYVGSGNGVPNEGEPYSNRQLYIGGPAEAASWLQAVWFTRRARKAGVNVQLSLHTGLHAWQTWRPEFASLLAWGPFGPTPGGEPVHRQHFTYRTMAPHGNAWGLGFRFSAPPTAIMTMTRDDQTLRATGTGEVTITPGAADDDATGAGARPDCAFTATLPFTRTLPAGC